MFLQRKMNMYLLQKTPPSGFRATVVWEGGTKQIHKSHEEIMITKQLSRKTIKLNFQHRNHWQKQLGSPTKDTNVITTFSLNFDVCWLETAAMCWGTPFWNLTLLYIHARRVRFWPLTHLLRLTEMETGQIALFFTRHCWYTSQKWQ